MCNIRRWLALAFIVSQAVVSAAALGQEPARFVTVNQGTDEFSADKQLHIKLGGLVKNLEPEPHGYEVVVQTATENEGNSRFLARMTPYVYVASEMQGAKLDVIGTYLSKSTGKTTYHSYFVVRRDAFTGIEEGDTPSLSRVVEWLHKQSRQKEPLKFLYHSRWSTSSYFHPSLYFRSQRIFAISEESGEVLSTNPAELITEIFLGKNDSGSSSDLVRSVAGEQGKGKFAAVWDGTRQNFQDLPENEPDDVNFGKQVYFVQIPGELPNDLLIVSRSVDKKTKEGIENILKECFKEDRDRTDGGPKDCFELMNTKSDVKTWLHWSNTDSRNARAALSVLRRRAATQPAPIVINVRIDNDSPFTDVGVLEAVRQAVRLSGTELVLHDDSYKAHNVEWILSRVHDGALKLTATYDNFSLNDETVEQEFRVSYLDDGDYSDLTSRVVMLIHDRMHRIRPVWLYQNEEPTVIRDVDFGVPPGQTIPFTEIDWQDPESNLFERGKKRETTVKKQDFSKLTLDRVDFPKTPSSTLDFEPMRQKEYRVLLIRPSEERLLFKFLTYVLVLLFFCAAVLAIWDLKRSATKAAHSLPPGAS